MKRGHHGLELERARLRAVHRRRPDTIPIPGPGQESVWDYPRPPRVEPVDRTLRVEFAGYTLAETTRGLRVIETAGPPVYYFPLSDVRPDVLEATACQTLCEWKGMASYWTVRMGTRVAEYAAWSYLEPDPAYRALKGFLAFYPGLMDACYVGDRRVSAQPGSFYGGWITPDILGPFKGDPGTESW